MEPGNRTGLWAALRRPSAKYSLMTLLVGGFIAGILFWGGFNTAMEATNTLEFCVSCHEMRDTVYQEYKKTVHYQNRTGVRAICSDCHVPKDWTHKRMKAADSRECRNCHSFEGMNPAKQQPRAQQPHSKATERKQTCIDCHKGIAHQKPKGMKDEDEEE